MYTNVYKLSHILLHISWSIIQVALLAVHTPSPFPILTVSQTVLLPCASRKDEFVVQSVDLLTIQQQTTSALMLTMDILLTMEQQRVKGEHLGRLLVWEHEPAMQAGSIWPVVLWFSIKWCNRNFVCMCLQVCIEFTHTCVHNDLNRWCVCPFTYTSVLPLPQPTSLPLPRFHVGSEPIAVKWLNCSHSNSRCTYSKSTEGCRPGEDLVVHCGKTLLLFYPTCTHSLIRIYVRMYTCHIFLLFLACVSIKLPGGV